MQHYQGPAESLSAILPASAQTSGGRLALAGLDLEELVGEHGSPLYIYDRQTLMDQIAEVQSALLPINARISYAAKACAILAILRLFRDHGLALDVVSAGEFTAGLRAGFAPEQIHLHGNCKTDEELAAAVKHGLHAIVVDNLDEVHRLEAFGLPKSKVRVMLRLNLPLEAQTHPHLQTSGARSKFGVQYPSREFENALEVSRRSRVFCLAGLHVHLGSQISDASIHRRAADEIVHVAQKLVDSGFPIDEVSIGGGWAVAYRPDERTLSPAAVAEAIRPAFTSSQHLRPAVEPGRALVARAGIALYRVGSVKQIEGQRLIAVEGGMGDNLRPALYGAEYHALVPARIDDPPTGVATIVGRYCESGDVLVGEIELPEVRVGDVLCIPVSGAYQVSMAAAYNLVPPPAVLMAERGEVTELSRRGTVDDLLARDSGAAP